MPRKLPSTSLNLSTFTTLYSYGYRNIFELEPLLAVAQTRLPLVGALPVDPAGLVGAPGRASR